MLVENLHNECMGAVTEKVAKVFPNNTAGKHHRQIYECRIVAYCFFPSNAFMASARSSNTFNCMLQTRVN